MYQEFSVVSIESVLNKKQILITTNQEININTFKDTVVEIYERGSKNSVLFFTEINDKVLTITFKDWPVPNSEYILSIKELLSITDEALTSSVKKKIKFESSIVSTVSVISPGMFEQIELLNIELKEVAAKPEFLKGSFYIEISKDNAFIDTVIKTCISKTSFKLALPSFGQYFMRIRVQDEIDLSQYGMWSELITFKYGNVSESGEIPEIEDPDIEEDPTEPEVDIEDFELISELEQGVTPVSLILEFSKDIDELSLDNIIIIRKAVK